MKNSEAGNCKISEEAFCASLVVVLLVVLPQFAAVGMEIGAAIGIALYLWLFPDRFRNLRGSLAPGIILLTVLVALAAGAVVISFVRGR